MLSIPLCLPVTPPSITNFKRSWFFCEWDNQCWLISHGASSVIPAPPEQGTKPHPHNPLGLCLGAVPGPCGRRGRQDYPVKSRNTSVFLQLGSPRAKFQARDSRNEALGPPAMSQPALCPCSAGTEGKVPEPCRWDISPMRLSSPPAAQNSPQTQFYSLWGSEIPSQPITRVRLPHWEVQDQEKKKAGVGLLKV